MRERVERHGGAFQLSSQPGRTVLTASFPLSETAWADT